MRVVSWAFRSPAHRWRRLVVSLRRAQGIFRLDLVVRHGPLGLRDDRGRRHFAQSGPCFWAARIWVSAGMGVQLPSAVARGSELSVAFW